MNTKTLQTFHDFSRFSVNSHFRFYWLGYPRGFSSYAQKPTKEKKTTLNDEIKFFTSKIDRIF